MFKKILLLLLVLAAMVAGFHLQKYLKVFLDPQRSFLHFLLFMLVYLVIIFMLVFVTGFVIIYFKDFFFKK